MSATKVKVKEQADRKEAKKKKKKIEYLISLEHYASVICKAKDDEKGYNGREIACTREKAKGLHQRERHRRRPVEQKKNIAGVDDTVQSTVTDTRFADTYAHTYTLSQTIHKLPTATFTSPLENAYRLISPTPMYLFLLVLSVSVQKDAQALFTQEKSIKLKVFAS